MTHANINKALINLFFPVTVFSMGVSKIYLQFSLIFGRGRWEKLKKTQQAVIFEVVEALLLIIKLKEK